MGILIDTSVLIAHERGLLELERLGAGVIDAFPVLAIDLLTARVRAQLGAGLADAGTPVGTYDLWIAASAVGRGLGLATLDAREFERVPGLQLEVWSLGCMAKVPIRDWRTMPLDCGSGGG